MVYYRWTKGGTVQWEHETIKPWKSQTREYASRVGDAGMLNPSKSNGAAVTRFCQAYSKETRFAMLGGKPMEWGESQYTAVLRMKRENRCVSVSEQPRTEWVRASRLLPNGMREISRSNGSERKSQTESNKPFTLKIQRKQRVFSVREMSLSVLRCRAGRKREIEPSGFGAAFGFRFKGRPNTGKRGLQKMLDIKSEQKWPLIACRRNQGSFLFLFFILIILIWF